MARILSTLAAFAAVILSSFGSSHAIEATESNIPVAYALLLDGKDAIFGQFVCQVHVRCQLIGNQDTDVQLSVTIDSLSRLLGEVDVQCSQPGCSFLSWRTSARFEGAPSRGAGRQFDLYAGKDGSVCPDLAYCRRARIGQILFLFGNR